MKWRLILRVAACSLALTAGRTGRPDDDVSSVLQGVGVEQRLGARVPLDLEFVDGEARPVRIGEYFGRKPVILTLVYYECPMLCNLVLNGLLRALRAVSFDVGTEFDVVTVSFDPRESSELAARKKDSYLKQYGRAGAAGGWHFLTGQRDAIRRLTESVGFRYSYRPETGEYAHASGVIVLTPEGKVSRYFYGVEYSARDLRLALVEAAENEIGSLVDEVLLLCMQYDPARGRYGVVVLRVMRLAGVLTVVVLAAAVVAMLWRERRASRPAAGGRRSPASEAAP